MMHLDSQSIGNEGVTLVLVSPTPLVATGRRLQGPLPPSPPSMCNILSSHHQRDICVFGQGGTHALHSMHASHTHLSHIYTHIIHAYSLDTQTHHMRRHSHTYMLTQVHTHAHEHACMPAFACHTSQSSSTHYAHTHVHTHTHTHTQNTRVLPQAQAAGLTPPCLQPPHHSQALKQRAPLLCSSLCSPGGS